MEYCAAWVEVSGDLRIKTTRSARWRWLTARRGVLYAFCSGEKPLFIGKTIGTLSKRLADIKEAQGSSSPRKMHEAIRRLISSGKEVRILVLAKDVPLSWGGFSLDLAAGIEKSLVSFFLPPWNRVKGGRFLTETEINGQSD
jgi:hypothetical protein